MSEIKEEPRTPPDTQAANAQSADPKQGSVVSERADTGTSLLQGQGAQPPEISRATKNPDETVTKDLPSGVDKSEEAAYRDYNYFQQSAQRVKAKVKDVSGISSEWTGLASMVWTYEEKRVKRWRNEINTLLIFAGLFSAVLTTFASQYYTLIQLGPANFNTDILERQTKILERIASQLTNSTARAVAQASGTPMADTLTGASPSDSLPLPRFPPRWVATLWFVSLVFSLSSASIALVVNQWLNFHAEQAGLRSVPQKLWTWRLRREALDKWKVEFIVSLLPLLLQIALILFLLGIIGYLGEVGVDIAVPSAIFTSALLLFLIATSVLPALVEYSPYKSPQALWMLRVSARMAWIFHWLLLRMQRVVKGQHPQEAYSNQESPPTGPSHIFTAILSVLHQVMSRLVAQVGKSHVLACETVQQAAATLRRISSSAWLDRGRLQRQLNHLRLRMEIPSWLGHEALCLHGISSKEAEKALFSDIHSISPDAGVFSATFSCLEEISPSIAVENVKAIGKAKLAALPTQNSKSGEEEFQYDELDRRVTAAIGRLVLVTFIRQLTRDSASSSALEEPSNCQMLATLFRTMSHKDAIDIQVLLFSLLSRNREVVKQMLECPGADAKAVIEATGRSKQLRKNIVALIYQTCVFESSFLSESVPNGVLFRPCNVEEWNRMKGALSKSAFPGNRDFKFMIHTSTILLMTFYWRDLYDNNLLPGEQTVGNYTCEVLRTLEDDLATISGQNMSTALETFGGYSQLCKACFLWQDILKFSSQHGNAEHLESETRLKVLQSFNRIARQLQWLTLNMGPRLYPMDLLSLLLRSIVKETHAWAIEERAGGDWEGPIKCAADETGSNGGEQQDVNHQPTSLSTDDNAEATRQEAEERTQQPREEGLRAVLARSVVVPIRTIMGGTIPPEQDLEIGPVVGISGGSDTRDVSGLTVVASSTPNPSLQGPRLLHVAEPQAEAGAPLRGPSGDNHQGADTGQGDICEGGTGPSDHIRQEEVTSEHGPKGTGGENERRGEAGPERNTDHGESVAGPPAANVVAEDGAVTNGDSANDSPGGG